jgi:hypothetical protein
MLGYTEDLLVWQTGLVASMVQVWPPLGHWIGSVWSTLDGLFR